MLAERGPAVIRAVFIGSLGVLWGGGASPRRRGQDVEAPEGFVVDGGEGLRDPDQTEQTGCFHLICRNDAQTSVAWLHRLGHGELQVGVLGDHRFQAAAETQPIVTEGWKIVGACQDHQSTGEIILLGLGADFLECGASTVVLLQEVLRVAPVHDLFVGQPRAHSFPDKGVHHHQSKDQEE